MTFRAVCGLFDDDRRHCGTSLPRQPLMRLARQTRGWPVGAAAVHSPVGWSRLRLGMWTHPSPPPVFGSLRRNRSDSSGATRWQSATRFPPLAVDTRRLVKCPAATPMAAGNSRQHKRSVAHTSQGNCGQIFHFWQASIFSRNLLKLGTHLLKMGTQKLVQNNQ